MKYDKQEEQEKLEQVNEELIRYMRDYSKEGILLSSIGNSISDGFSMSEPGRLLLDRNLGLVDYGKKNGVDVDLYHLSRSENNNAVAVAKWIADNCSERDSYNWNRADYERAIKEGHPLLSQEEIDEFFKGGSEIGVQDVIFNPDKAKANIIILNLGTGSFLDIVTRHGSLTIPNIDYSIDRDGSGIRSIFEMIQNNNRDNNTNTQVYLCGAPRLVNTILTDLCMNPTIKRVGKEFANVTYVPSFPRQAFYRTPSGGIVPDPHYNQAEYLHFLSEIEKKIIDNYSIRDFMIDLDRILNKMSVENDVNGGNYNLDDVKDVIDDIAKNYESVDGDYNYFIDFIKSYIRVRYPFDFYRLYPENNIANELDDMKKTR